MVFAGGVLKWVTEFKYLGVPITQGRRKRIPLPEPQLWQSYHRIKDVLRGPYPLLDQLMLVKATMMNVALYPAAVRGVDYDGFFFSFFLLIVTNPSRDSLKVTEHVCCPKPAC